MDEFHQQELARLLRHIELDRESAREARIRAGIAHARHHRRWDALRVDVLHPVLADVIAGLEGAGHFATVRELPRDRVRLEMVLQTDDVLPAVIEMALDDDAGRALFRGQRRGGVVHRSAVDLADVDRSGFARLVLELIRTFAEEPPLPDRPPWAADA